MASALVMYMPYVGPTAIRRKLWFTDCAWRVPFAPCCCW